MAALRRVDDELQDRQLLADVIEKIGKPAWDVLIVGDGSGSGWNGAAGWACTLIERQTNNRRFFYGGCDCGSISLAETMPYIQAMSWYDQYCGKERLKQLGHLNVHVLTDSETVRHWGEYAAADRPPRKMLPLWCLLSSMSRLGYRFHFHWAARMSTELNWAADLIAGLCRREIMNASNPAYVAGIDHATRAANALSNLRIHDESGKMLNPYLVNPLE